MAELTTTGGCCAPETQASCCEPSDKAGCCETHPADGCGCAEGATAGVDAETTRELVRRRYADAARAIAAGSAASCGSDARLTDARGDEVFGAALYAAASEAVPLEAALEGSLGCGVPTAVADLRPGETVLDLGSGAGADALVSARRVAPGGRAIGLDMTDEMLDLARRNADAAAVENVTFLKGRIENIPLPDASVDVVISNCVINLAADKAAVIGEAARVLRPGGRFAVSDVLADDDMDDATRADMREWTGCIAGALTEDQFRSLLAASGLAEVQIRPTHRVHHAASAAIIQARKPSA